MTSRRRRGRPKGSLSKLRDGEISPRDVLSRFVKEYVPGGKVGLLKQVYETILLIESPAVRSQRLLEFLQFHFPKQAAMQVDAFVTDNRPIQVVFSEYQPGTSQLPESTVIDITEEETGINGPVLEEVKAEVECSINPQKS